MIDLPAVQLVRWRLRPDIMVRELFGVVPDAWQDRTLRLFPRSPRLAMRASKGPGKTAVLAWMAWNFLLTRSHPKIGAVSITAQNLAVNLWTEMAKWRNESELLKAKFTWTHGRITCNDHPETWFMEAMAWPKTASVDQQADTLAGFHADYVMFVIDESGGIPPAVLVAADAALGSCVEGHIVQAGNTNSRAGMLYEACVTDRKRWEVVTVTGDPDDPERSPRVSIEWAQGMIDRHGRDNNWVMVNVLGQFPTTEFNTLLSLEDIHAAQARSYSEYDIEKAPRVLGFDAALWGDDVNVIFPRQGLVAFSPIRLRGVKPHLVAGRIAAKWQEWGADALFADNTGGYGAPVISHLELEGFAPIPVGFAEKANDEQFFNKRAEIYFLGAQWIMNGGQLPPANVPGMAEFTAAWTQTTYTAKRDKFIIEPKELIKARLGFSPDDTDAFCLTFAQPVAPRSMNGRRRGTMKSEYSPIEAYDTQKGGGMKSDYRPYGS